MIIKCVKIMIVHTMLNIKCYFCCFWHFCTIISHIWFWSELKIRKKWFWQQWNTNKHDEANVKLMIVVGWYTNTRFYFVHSSVQPQNGHLNRLNFKSESMWDGFQQISDDTDLQRCAAVTFLWIFTVYIYFNSSLKILL